jgi:hypothetical protein
MMTLACDGLGHRFCNGLYYVLTFGFDRHGKPTYRAPLIAGGMCGCDCHGKKPVK